MRRWARGQFATALVGLVLFAVAGCSAGAPSPRPSPMLPASLPASVPVVPGRILASDVSADEWKVWVRTPDPAAGYTAAMAALTKAGMHVTSTQTFSNSGTGQACDDKYCATVSAYNDPKYGPSVEYEVFSSQKS